LNLSFKKEEHLCSKKAFDNLLKTGSSLFCYPLKIQWVKTDFPLPCRVQIAFAVPKKRFKRAVDRNLIKRRLREAYRLNKGSLYSFLEERQIRLQILFVYIAPDILTYRELEPKIKKALDSIMDAVQKTAQ
jgi:ribonuclease P protein component, eubacterial